MISHRDVFDNLTSAREKNNFDGISGVSSNSAAHIENGDAALIVWVLL